MVHYAATVGYRVRRTVCAVGFFLFFPFFVGSNGSFWYQFHGGFYLS